MHVYKNTFAFIVDVKLKIYFSRRAMMENTPKKLVQKGRKPKSNENYQLISVDFVCSFKVKFVNLDKISDISTENLFRKSNREDCHSKATLQEMCGTLRLHMMTSQRTKCVILPNPTPVGFAHKIKAVS